jgi:general secretion pathway protein D
MKPASPATRTWRLATLAAALWLAGCAAQQHNGDGMKLLHEGKVAEGLQNLRKASELEPNNARYRIDYLTQRELATQAVLSKADDARASGRLDEAADGYRQALQLDPGNERAQRGARLAVEQRKADAAIAQADKYAKAGQTESAQDVLRRAAKDLPGNASVQAQLKAQDDRIESDRAARERAQAAQSAFRKPVSLQFRDANLKMVFEALSRTANVNIILDRDVKSDLKTTIYVKDASVEDTIDLILLQNQLEKRVLNNNTLFVYPATAPKQKEYSELKVRSFQLSNIEAAHVANIIKSLLKTKDIVTDARTNTLVMRDTADAIAVAEKLVAANDVPDPEVMLEVQVLEVSADRMSNLGIKWPDAFSVSTPKNAVTVGDYKALTRNDLVVSSLGVALNLMLQDTETNILASPRIRTRNKEKARILVGDKVPVITNLLTPQQAGATSVITGSIQYVDVGIKLEVEPQVYVDGDVGIKINLEVSNIAKTITTDSGIAYQIGTRSAQTSLRLKDGETQVLAGLINDQDRSTASKVPGLGQVPVAGRLFSSNNGNATKSEIVLSITPHIIRPQTLPEARTGDVWSGTESVVREKPLRLDPIGAARSGNLADMPALAPSGAGAPGTAGAPAPQPATAPKAGGAGGSTILNASRAPIDAAGPAAAPAADATGAGTGTGRAAGSPVPAAGGVMAGSGTGASTPPPVISPRRPAPASIQPGRAMAPAAPSAPAGTAPPAPPAAPADEG